MKRNLYTLAAVLFTFLIILNACQKDDNFEYEKEITSIKAKILRIVDNQKGGLNIFVSVTNQKGEAIKGLSKKNFEITMIEGNIETPIPITDSTSLPSVIITALTMDYSGSMYGDTVSIPAMETALGTFVNMKNTYDHIEIIKFSDSIDVTVPLTTSTTSLLNGIADTSFAGHGFTSFYRAVIKGLDDVQTLAASNPTYLPSVIGFTDGWNNRTPLTMDTLLLNSLLIKYPFIR